MNFFVGILILTTAIISGDQANLSREEVIKRFKARASIEEIGRFERALTSRDSASETQAIELVLFQLTSEELFQLGVTQVEQYGSFDWAVAWSDDSPKNAVAISAALQPEQITAFSSCGLAGCGWYVPREHFFRARKALLASNEIRARKIKITEPRFKIR